ncbi:MAG: hypothetical protein ACR2QM_09220, partial [Longimicrobiales bacterium]
MQIPVIRQRHLEKKRPVPGRRLTEGEVRLPKVEIALQADDVVGEAGELDGVGGPLVDRPLLGRLEAERPLD